MLKKRIIIALFVLFPLVVGLACLGSGSQETEEPEEEEVVVLTEATEEEVAEEPTQEPEEESGEPQDLLLLDNSLWFQEDTTVFVSFFFENPNADILFEDVEYTVYLYDADGDEIDSDYSTVRWIFPSQIFGIVFNFYLADEDILVDAVTVDWEYDDASSPDGFTYPFGSNEALFWENDDWPMVTGKIVNDDAETYTDIRTNVICYNTAGEIVGGGYTYVDFVPGTGYMGFSTYVDVIESVAFVEVFPTFTYSTVYYEGDDFWSEISFLDDYFYEGEYDSIYGGAVIQSNVDYVLEDSIVYATFYDEDGNVTSTGDIYVDILLPGDTLGVAPWVLSPPDGSNTTQYDILVLPGDVVDDYELTENPFVVNSAELTGDYNDQVTVNFTNTYTKQVSEVDVYVLVYNAEGLIIGGGNDWTEEPVPAGGSAELEIWIDCDSTEMIDSITVWVAPNYWTEFE